MQIKSGIVCYEAVGRFVVDIFTPIEWNKNAFNRFVLPAGIKLEELIDSLVRADRQAGSTVIQDIIAGKGIIVLHRRQGTGRTLTAEAVADELEKRPLSVSVGDLGPELGEKFERNTRIGSALRRSSKQGPCKNWSETPW